jgi:hypothetical protein
LRAEVVQRLDDAGEVARFVVDDGDHFLFGLQAYMYGIYL